MKLSELQKKDIININDGKKIGRIIDIEINSLDGSLINLIIEKKYFKTLFNNENDVLVKFNQIKKLGDDVILIDVSN